MLSNSDRIRFPQRGVSQQTGLAIITVLLIIALMVTLLGFLVEQQHLLIRRIGNQNVAEQGFQYSGGVDAWAMRLLHDDPDRQIDHWEEDWAIFGDPPETNADGEREFSLDPSSQQEREKLPEIDFGFDGLEYQITDLQSRYNLNNLAAKEPQLKSGQRAIFLNLLSLLEVGELEDREKLYASLIDWIDENKEESPNGTESGNYQIKRTPYFAADQKLTSLGELRFIEGFSEEIINALQPYVTVLPVDNAKINLNTTTSEVMSSLSAVPVADTGSVDLFLAERLEEGFGGFNPGQIEAAKTAILGLVPSEGRIVPGMLQTNSQFFEINSRVVLGDYVYCAQTTVLRENPDGPDGPKVTVLNRQYNTLCNEIIR